MTIDSHVALECLQRFCSQASAADIDIIYDVCWMLSPMQIQRLCTNYYVADYEVSRALH